jgi:hypothetical protein
MGFIVSNNESKEFSGKFGEIKEGFGYNTILGKRMNVLCTGTFFTPGNAKNQVLIENMEVIEKVYEFEKIQKSSFKASGSYGAFSAGVSGSFANTLKINNYSCYLVATVSILNPTKYLENIKLTEKAKSILAEDREKFFRIYGDHYINGLVTGGELFIAYEFTSKHKEEKSKVAAALKASIKAFKTGGKYEQSIKEMANFDKKQIAIYNSALKPGVPLPDLNLDDLKTYIKDFPKQINTEGNYSVLGFELQEINKIEELIGEENIFDLNKIHDLRKNRIFIQESIENYLDWDRDIQYVLRNKEQFEEATLVDATEDSKDVKRKVEKMDNLMKRAYDTENMELFDSFDKLDYNEEPTEYGRKIPSKPTPRKRRRRRRKWYQVTIRW